MACLRGKFQGGVILNGRYETLSPLNHGSFGMVFKAHDIKTNNIVAIKCLTKLSAAADVNADFAVDDKSEELALHSRLSSHPNIVNFVETFETEAHTYLVLEFCPQGDLYEAIRNGHGPLETEHVRQFMYELVDAVEYIHSKGVFHRDIKPENIFLLQDGSMKLGDFGLATTDEWSHEMSVGSDRYMAPEQFDSEGAGYAPAKADIWAIGICLLNILFSRNPFTTPTASDPLFLDFSRDKESLFDVFPSMSLDTYEVIEQCMNMDPKKRSLEGVREALIRVVAFTTEDEVLDEFCAEKATIASANREPLRTPSIQSPAVDTGSFPWAKALNAMPGRCHGRQLSVIPDDESYTEDLFPASEDSHTDWCSASVQTNSVPASSLGASMHSLAISQRPNARPSPVAESLPISMAQPMKPSLSTIFGRRNDGMSKSWSDMWEEEEEEEEEARVQQLNSLKAMNSRTWSHEAEVEAEPKKSVHPEHITGDVDDDLVADGFFFHEPLPPQPPSSTPRYSPPSKRSNMDKWAALGERRRQRSETSEFETSPDTQSRRFFALDSSKSYEAGVWDYSNFLHNKNNNNHTIIHFHNKQPNWVRDVKDRSKECPWNKGRESWRRDRRHDFGDVEWVGGW